MGIFVQLHVGLQEERGLLHVLAAVQHGPRELHQHLLYASELIDVLYMVEALLIADMDHLVSLRNWIGVFYKYNTGYFFLSMMRILVTKTFLIRKLKSCDKVGRC